MSLLPIFVDVRDVLVTVTGSGAEALSAARRLAGLGARVRLVARDAGPARAAGIESCDVIEALPAAAHLDGARLLVAASEPSADDEPILAAAEAQSRLAVAMSDPSTRAWLGECVERGRLAVAATTRGASPELEARLASEASRVIAPEHERLAEIFSTLRAKLAERFPDEERRTAIWQMVLDSPVLVLLQSGEDDAAQEMAERMAWGTG